MVVVGGGGGGVCWCWVLVMDGGGIESYVREKLFNKRLTSMHSGQMLWRVLKKYRNMQYAQLYECNMES